METELENSHRKKNKLGTNSTPCSLNYIMIHYIMINTYKEAVSVIMRWLKAYIKASWSYCESQNNVGTDHLGNSHPPASARSYLCCTFTSRLVGDHQDVTVTHIIQVFEGEDLEDFQKTEDWDLGPGARPGVNHFKRVRHHLLAKTNTTWHACRSFAQFS